MDGAYIPENCIIEDISLSGPVYSTEAIKAPSAMRIAARNRQKAGIWISCVPVLDYGIFLTRCFICPAILIMFCKSRLVFSKYSSERGIGFLRICSAGTREWLENNNLGNTRTD